jgi:competence protein ComEC
MIGVTAAIVLGSCASSQIKSLSWPPKDWSVVSCDVGQGDATVLKSGGLVAVVDVGREPRPIDTCLRRLGITRVDLLVLTHFDLDHVGGLEGLLGGREVDLALITSYADERPAAARTYKRLSANAKRVLEVGKGYSGRLGEFEWSVLSPHWGAAEAEDSNDGSVSMLFECPRFVFLGLADLGERAQRRLAGESADWLGQGFGDLPLIVKVAHHGSGDQYPELYEALQPAVALFSVGQGNEYGHPTQRTLALLARAGAWSFRTDLSGSIALAVDSEGLQTYTSGRG